MSIYKKMGAPSTEQVVEVLLQVKAQEVLELPSMYKVGVFLKSNIADYKNRFEIDNTTVEALEALSTTKRLEGMNEGVFLAINNSILDKRNNLVNFLES